MTKLVNIGKRKVPLVLGNGVTEVYFSAGVHGKRERGYYRFWTLVGEDLDGAITISGRARRSLDAGDRFARMAWSRTTMNPYAHRLVYRRMYRVANTFGYYVRPTTARELSNWISSHKRDMAFARRRCLISGRKRNLPK